DVKPRQGRPLAILTVRIPTVIELRHSRIEPIQTNPDRAYGYANHNPFPTQFPAHLLDERPHLPYEPCADHGLESIHPVARIMVVAALHVSEHDEDREGRDARKLR